MSRGRYRRVADGVELEAIAEKDAAGKVTGYLVCPPKGTHEPPYRVHPDDLIRHFTGLRDRRKEVQSAGHGRRHRRRRDHITRAEDQQTASVRHQRLDGSRV